MSTTWEWRLVRIVDVLVYVQTLMARQPQYYVDADAAAAVILSHVAAGRDHRYYIGTNDRNERVVFRLVEAVDPPLINQYGAAGPNWLTAFGRGVPAVRDQMVALGIYCYDLAEIRLDVTGDRLVAGRLLSAELEKLTTGPSVIAERPGSSAIAKRYRMVAA